MPYWHLLDCLSGAIQSSYLFWYDFYSWVSFLTNHFTECTRFFYAALAWDALMWHTYLLRDIHCLLLFDFKFWCNASDFWFLSYWPWKMEGKVDLDKWTQMDETPLSILPSMWMILPHINWNSFVMIISSRLLKKVLRFWSLKLERYAVICI